METWDATRNPCDINIPGRVGGKKQNAHKPRTRATSQQGRTPQRTRAPENPKEENNVRMKFNSQDKSNTHGTKPESQSRDSSIGSIPRLPTLNLTTSCACTHFLERSPAYNFGLDIVLLTGLLRFPSRRRCS